MTRRTGIPPLLGFVIPLLGLSACGGDTLYDPEDVIPNRPPVALLSATPLEGIAPDRYPLSATLPRLLTQ